MDARIPLSVLAPRADGRPLEVPSLQTVRPTAANEANERSVHLAFRLGALSGMTRGADRANSYTLARVTLEARAERANFYESPKKGIRRRAIAADTWAMSEGHSHTQADNGAAQSQNDTGASGPAATLAGVSIAHLSVIQSDGARTTAATATADRDRAARRLIEWTGRQSRTARNRALDGARLALTFRMARNVSPDNRGGETLPVPHPFAPAQYVAVGADNSRATGEGDANPFPFPSLVRARAALVAAIRHELARTARDCGAA